MENLTQDRLREVLAFDPESGAFTWRTRPCNAVRIGELAGRVTAAGYRIIQIDRRSYQAARLAWLYVHGEWPKHILRFVNDDTADCRIDNLRDTRGATDGLSYKEHRRDYFKNFALKKDFGISLADYQRMFVEQKGVCAICDQPETGERNGRTTWLAVDHDHSTDAVRGLLCASCNKGIGHLRDSIETLTRAIGYLKRHAPKTDADNVVAMPTKTGAA